MSVQKSEPFSQRLYAITNEAEIIFNHLLGYVIAFTSIVAFADVLGNGQVLQFSPYLYWVWVGAQGLCVEFQVFILVKRMPGYWQNNQAMFWTYGGFIGCLCLMSIMVGSIFVQHDQEHGSVEQAMSTLGIPHIGFIYARAALAILLVVLIAVDRAIEQHRSQAAEVVQSVELSDRFSVIQQQQQEYASALAQVVTSIKDMQTRNLAFSQELRGTVQEVQGMNRIVTELHGMLPQIVDQHFTSQVEVLQQGIVEQLQALLLLPQARSETIIEPRLELVARSTSDVGSEVQRFIANELEEKRVPTLSQIMDATGCSKGTASRYRSQMMNEQSA